jgi:glutamate racemase
MESQIQELIVPQEQPGELSPAAAATVGVFDSGVGGFTVASAVLKRRPELNLVYFGDTLNMPYGGRTAEQLTRFAHNSIEFLLEQGIEILAVGCNASNSVLGQGELHSFGVPVFDLVSSTLEVMRGMYGRPERAALLATAATINSRYWERKLRDAIPELDLLPIAAPEFVPLIEAQQIDERLIRMAVHKQLAPVLNAGVRTVIHGCTHFPLLQDYMLELCPELVFIDPAQCLAERLAASLPPAPADAPLGRLRLYSSLPGETFFRVGEQALGRPVREHSRMYIVNPYED